jgi:hypothetical protein
MSEREKLTGDEIADRAAPVALSILNHVEQTCPDVLTAVVALECAKRTLTFMGKQSFGDDFVEQVNRLMRGFEGSEEAMVAMIRGAFMQPGGKS